jgi:hypothetical protein
MAKNRKYLQYNLSGSPISAENEVITQMPKVVFPYYLIL